MPLHLIVRFDLSKADLYNKGCLYAIAFNSDI